MRHHMHLPDDHGAELRLVRVPRRGHLLSVAQGLQHRHESDPGHVPNRERQLVQKLYVGFVRRMVPDQDDRLLPADLRHRQAERHQSELRKLHQNEQRRLSAGKY